MKKLINPDDGADISIPFGEEENVQILEIKKNEQKEFEDAEADFLRSRFQFLIDPDAPEEKKLVEYGSVPDEVWIALQYHKEELLHCIREQQLNVLPQS